MVLIFSMSMYHVICSNNQAAREQWLNSNKMTLCALFCVQFMIGIAPKFVFLCSSIFNDSVHCRNARSDSGTTSFLFSLNDKVSCCAEMLIPTSVRFSFLDIARGNFKLTENRTDDALPANAATPKCCGQTARF